jgi:hypothetical protein
MLANQAARAIDKSEHGHAMAALRELAEALPSAGVDELSLPLLALAKSVVAPGIRCVNGMISRAGSRVSGSAQIQMPLALLADCCDDHARTAIPEELRSSAEEILAYGQRHFPQSPEWAFAAALLRAEASAKK